MDQKTKDLLKEHRRKKKQAEATEMNGRKLHDVIKQRISEGLSRSVPRHCMGYAEKIAKGCRKSAIRLMCLECMGYNAAEARRCCAPKCPLYMFRMGKTPISKNYHHDLDKQALGNVPLD